ncbi:MAG: GYF domain-containing protein, partial [Candidatus Saccharimonadales bacterium]
PAVAAATAANAVDAIAEAPGLQWYAAPPGATSQYGPASGEEFRAWMHEGRITADALIWRQDWADWKRAGSVFPQLETPTAAGAPPVAPLGPATATPLPTASAAMPMAAGGPPVAQPAFPMAGAMPGVVPTAAPIATDAFPITAEEPGPRRSSVAHGRGYRQRSNTGPIIAIVVLLVVMIPLSYFAVKMILEQLGSSPPAETAAGANGPKE